MVTGVDPVAMDAALVSLAWDLPRAVSVRHRIDPHSQVLTRVVSDATGLLEREEVPLEHACVACALREDILPTLERLARDDRWDTIASGLPVATEAGQLVHVLGVDTRLARHLALSSVVAAVAHQDAVQDLLGDGLLRERDRHTGPADDRGLGETACAQIELADLVVLDGDPGAEATALVRALARPDATVVTGTDQLDGSLLATGRHAGTSPLSWSAPDLRAEVPPLGDSVAWRLDLRSPRAFHPDRLLEQIERLGSGAHRSRGCFWLPTRPDALGEWSGAGGQLSIGSHSRWGRRTPQTRLVVTGLGPEPADLAPAFAELLLTPEEARRSWVAVEDGLEPWLGDIRDAA